jgi:hypothetical protein
VDYFDAEKEVLFGPMLFENSVPDDASFGWILGQDPSLKEHLVKLKQKSHSLHAIEDIIEVVNLILVGSDAYMKSDSTPLHRRNLLDANLDLLRPTCL